MDVQSAAQSAMSPANSSALDAVTVKVLWDRLVSIVEEATVAQYRTAFSTVVQEANDFACSIMDKEGGTLANSQTGLPSFVATQAITLRHLLQRFSQDSIRPGDAFITNDPWIATGHSMDITLLSPVFLRNRLIAFAGSVAHAPDLGGAQRWNLSSEVFDEGLLIPLMKLHDRGTPNESLLHLIKANSRLPELTVGDLEAQLAALGLITTRLLEMVDEYGLDDLDDLVRAIYGRSEGAMRDAIRAIPDGRYVGEVISDNFPDPLRNGIQSDAPLVIRTTITVDDSAMTIDYAGSSPEAPGSFNSVWTFTTAYSLYAVRLILVPFFPNNDGFYQPFKVVCPEGTVVNARYPAATLSRHAVGHQVVDAIYAALADALPQAVLAQSGSTPSWDLLFMGKNTHGHPFHRILVISGGTGASPRRDGITACFPANISNTPVEVLESLTPLVCEAKEIIVDSAGTGRQRGGFGQRMIFRAMAPVRYSLINARVQYAPQGLLRGGQARGGHAYVGDRELLPGVDGSLAAGERLIIETPGGGGLGPLAGREPALVQRDLREGLMSDHHSNGANRISD